MQKKQKLEENAIKPQTLESATWANWTSKQMMIIDDQTLLQRKMKLDIEIGDFTSL